LPCSIVSGACTASGRPPAASTCKIGQKDFGGLRAHTRKVSAGCSAHAIILHSTLQES
jgi:hypothetical protein